MKMKQKEFRALKQVKKIEGNSLQFLLSFDLSLIPFVSLTH
jgi:hypothetical protein